MSRWASGDVDVLFAAEEAEVGRPFEDERLGRAADAEADADRPERRTIGELVAGPRGAAPRASPPAPRRPPLLRPLKVPPGGRGPRARVLCPALQPHPRPPPTLPVRPHPQH